MLRDFDSGDGEVVQFDAALMDEFMVRRAAVIETMPLLHRES